MRILVTGGDGQVGWELQRALAPLGTVAAFGRAALDLAQPDAIRTRVDEANPDVIVNAGAYTAVDKAESEPGLAHAVNAAAPGILAEEAKRRGALLVHYSTDYVFDGTKRDAYVETDPTHPLGVYGRSKLEGEQAIAAAGPRHVILRTSWVYASRGRNFLLTMLRLARERPELRVVDDQHGAPTWARDLAEATARIVAAATRDTPSGAYHATGGGATTWCGFAREIVRAAGLATPVHAIATADYPTPARRPANSVLSNAKLAATFAITLPDWRVSAQRCVAEAIAAG